MRHFPTASGFFRKLARALAALALAALGAAPLRAETGTNTPVVVPPVTPEWAMNLQHVFALADTSSPTNHPTIRVLYYGLSFTWAEWWVDTSQFLRTNHPDVDWRIENHAESGHTVEAAKFLAEGDVYPYQPDLIIFQDVGNPDDFAEMSRQFRSRTTADVIMFGNHVQNQNELKDAGYVGDGPYYSSIWFHHVWFPTLARTDGFAYINTRDPWLDHIVRSGLPVDAFLYDDHVHLNDLGSRVMGKIMMPFFAPPRMHPRPDPWNCGRVKTLVAGQDFQWSDDRVQVPFVGNRIDAVGPSGAPWHCRIKVDGKPVSADAGTYYADRPGGWPGTWVPACLRLGIAKPPGVQTWTFTITELLPEGHHFKFRLDGSASGFDGEGSTTADFVSNSGATFVETNAWNMNRYWGGPIYPGFKIPVYTHMAGTDQADAFPAVPAGRHPTVNLFSGIADGPHVLELEAIDATAANLASLRVYHPAGDDVGVVPGQVSHLLCRDQMAIITASGEAPAVETSEDLAQWVPAMEGTNVVSPDHGRRVHFEMNSSPTRYIRWK